MNKQHPFNFRSAALSAAIAQVMLFGAVNPAFSQEQEATIEEVLIVGSRIKRSDEVAASPVQTLDSEDLRLSGSLSLGETLQELPSVGASLNSNGSAGTSHGTSSINLRYLGENRALVLVNGHRWVNGTGTRGFRDFVDMNTIPQAIVDRVEVLQDGATAVYGADAIAGVVNIHTHKTYEGMKVTATYGQSSEGDRDTTNIDLLAGMNLGESNWMLGITHVKQDPIYTQDRDLTAIPLNGLAAGTPEGLFRENGLSGVTGMTATGTNITRDPGTDGSVLSNWRNTVSASDRYNRYHNNYVVGPLERTAVYLQNRTPLSDSLEFTLEALYNKRESDQQFSSVPPTIRGGSRGFMIANDPSVNPFGIEFSGSDFRVDNFFVDNGYRVNAQEVETLRFAAGLNGEMDNGWSWDAFVSWAENEGTFTSNNQINLDKLALGMRACDTTGLTGIDDLSSGCVPVNLFNPLTAEMVDYINFTGNDKNKTEQTDLSFNITGDLLEMSAGTLAFAAGFEYREESGLDTPDSTINSDPRVNTYRTTTSAPRDGTDGEYDLTELYVEFSIPLLESLHMDLASRYSDYSTFGDTTNSKVGLSWQATDDLMLRSTWAEGFRAPSILEMFEGYRETSIPVSDPCDTVSGTGGPGCSGIPSGYTQPTANVPASVGGNPDLEPETSENVTVGLVYTPSFIEGTSLTVDWYNIEVEDTISSYGAQNLLDLCASSGQRCGLISRDATGEITRVTDGPINLNTTEVSGYDVVIRHARELAGGDLDLTLSASRLLHLEQTSTLNDGSTLVEDKVGTAASRESYPDWRANFSAKWRKDNWAANYSARYIGDTEEMVSGEPRYIGSVVYHNVSAVYSFNDQLSLKLGIDNVADKQPPVSLTNLNINFDQQTYTAVGRYYYLQLSYDFAQ